MEIIHTSEMQTTPYYGLQCQPSVENFFKEGLPFGSKLCLVKSGITSTIHNHHEYECFFITCGAGTLTIANETETVKAGDVIRIPPFLDHTIHNPHQEELHFLTFWWEDLRALSAPSKLSDAKDTLIISTPPTPNGDLHLGHLSGPYTGADIYKRFLKLQTTKAFHMTGRDDNQSYVARKAFEQKRTPENLALDYATKIQNTFEKNAIVIDHFSEPHQSPYHVALVKKSVLELFDKSFIYEAEVDSLFCAVTGKYLYEAHVNGLCPHCNAGSDGCACEQCGQPNDVINLINPRSKYGDGTVEIRKAKKLYFKMSAFADALRKYHRTVIMPAHLSALCEKMLSQSLPDICISHISDWGIPVPCTGYENQTIYVWFEMALGYLAAAQETAEKSGLCKTNTDGWKYFYSNDNARVVHFFGFDNGYFHALLFPAIYLALDWDIRLPEAFVVNELLNLNGLKFSTSRNHLIWGKDLLKLTSSDYVRYYLSYIRPETSKNNFQLQEFVTVINEQLATTWQQWLASLFKRCEILFNNKVPAAGAWTVEHKKFFELVHQLLNETKNAYEHNNFSPQRVCRLANELVRETVRFSASQSHYENLDDAYNTLRTAIALELLAAKTLALLIQPIMPTFAEKLWEALEGDLTMQWLDTPHFVRDSVDIKQPCSDFFEHVQKSVYELNK
jgi:methionyl-tRNA synthetase